MSFLCFLLAFLLYFHDGKERGAVTYWKHTPMFAGQEAAPRPPLEKGGLSLPECSDSGCARVQACHGGTDYENNNEGRWSGPRGLHLGRQRCHCREELDLVTVLPPSRRTAGRGVGDTFAFPALTMTSRFNCQRPQTAHNSAGNRFPAAPTVPLPTLRTVSNQTRSLSEAFSKVALKREEEEREKVHISRGELASLGEHSDGKRLPWGRSGVIGIKRDKLVARC